MACIVGEHCYSFDQLSKDQGHHNRKKKTLLMIWFLLWLIQILNQNYYFNQIRLLMSSNDIINPQKIAFWIKIFKWFSLHEMISKRQTRGEKRITLMAHWLQSTSFFFFASANNKLKAKKTENRSAIN